ncbi:hypothetical protein [Roseisalinus antarcticus]|nr:hypothetical protein [Roseisalinus antarcticus]
MTTWVPRVSRSRQQLCGFEPSLGPAPRDDGPSREVVADAPFTETFEPETTIRSAAAPEPEAAPAPAPAAAPTPMPRVRRGADPGPPIETVATTIRTSAEEPRFVRVPQAPVRSAAPAPTPPPAESPRTMTRAEACAGRSGVLDGYVIRGTGRPLDCGPAETVRTAAPMAPAMAVATGEPALRPGPDGAIRVSLTVICARIARTGEAFLNRATGQPVACGDPTPPVTFVQAPQAPVVPSAPAAAGTAPVRTATAAPSNGCTNLSEVARQYIGSAGVRCGPQSEPITAYAAARSIPSRSATLSTSSTTLFQREPVPASNPTPASTAARTIPSPPAGYRGVWDDGRINPQRGLRGASYF